MTRQLRGCVDRTMVELPRRRSAGAAVSEAGSERSGAAANMEGARVFRSPKGHVIVTAWRDDVAFVTNPAKQLSRVCSRVRYEPCLLLSNEQRTLP